MVCLTRPAVCILLALLVRLMAVGPSAATAADTPTPGLEPALAAWREIPVLEDGRVMPLDTFARRHAETICNTQTPRLATGPGAAVVKWQSHRVSLVLRSTSRFATSRRAQVPSRLTLDSGNGKAANSGSKPLAADARLIKPAMRAAASPGTPTNGVPLPKKLM